MRLCIPVTQHFGLGNELMAIAKAFCAAEECGLRLVQPGWAREDRNYHHERYFPAPWKDRLLARYGRWQRSVTLTEADYRATGLIDYGQAARAFLESKGLIAGPLTFYAEGMWAGFPSIINSRPYVRSLLLRRPFTLSNYYAVARRLDPVKLTAAVHVRLGDFAPPSGEEWKPGTWNTRLPLEWYESVCGAVAAAFGPRVQFVLCSDGTAEECGRLIRRFQALHTIGQRLNSCSDLLLLADADLLVCSISSFSFWAAFLSERPYVVYARAARREGGCASLWERSADAASIPAGWHRGFLMDEETCLPEALATALERRLAEKAARPRDLVLGGCIPGAASR
jgi:hypothetical protein